MAKRTERATVGKVKTPRKASKKVGMKAKTSTKRAYARAPMTHRHNPAYLMNLEAETKI